MSMKKLNPTNGAKMKSRSSFAGQGSYGGPADGSGSRGTSKGKLNPTNGAGAMNVKTGQGSYRGPMDGTRGPTSTK